MNNQAELTQNAEEVISRYIRPNATLLTMERIHRTLFDEEVEFTAWEEVLDEFSDKEWDEELIRRFATLSKEIVEKSQSTISESYFLLVRSDDNSITPFNDLPVEYVSEQLDQTPYSPEDSGTGQDGFQYEIRDYVIDGRYIYSDVNTEISYSGEISSIIYEGSIEFRINCAEGLFIIESASVSDIQRIRSAVGKLTQLEVAHPTMTENNDGFDNFISSVHSDQKDARPSIIQIDEVRLTSADSAIDTDIEQLQLKTDSQNLAHSEIQERIDNGWEITSISLGMGYNGDLFDVNVGSNEIMFYLSIKRVSDFAKGKELIDELRPKLLDSFFDD